MSHEIKIQAAKLRIMIAGADVAIALDLESRIEALGYTVTTKCILAEEALEKVEVTAPDLVLMIIGPDCDIDIEVAGTIRDRTGIPVVFASARPNQEKLDRAMIDLPYGYLSKPFQERDIKITIDMALYVAAVNRERKEAERARIQHIELLETLERVDQTIQGSRTFSRALEDVLAIVLDVMGSDRAWLLFPLAPDTETYTVPMEVARSEWPGARTEGIDVPLSAAAAEIFKDCLEVRGPIVYGPTGLREVPEDTRRKFGVRCQLLMPIFPKVGKPWIFGLHQCSYDRIWTVEEKRLFSGIGRRLEDGLTGLLVLRDLRESEERYRAIAETAEDFIFCKDNDRRYTFLNPAMQRLLGRPLPELLGCTPEEVYDEQAAALIYEVDIRTLAGEAVSEIRTLHEAAHEKRPI